MSWKEKSPSEDVLHTLEARFPRIKQYEPVLLVAVNLEYSDLDARVSPGDEVSFFPSRERRILMIDIVESTIDRRKVMDSVAGPGSGAIVTFDGTVRDNARGKPVTHLYYEAYSENGRQRTPEDPQPGCRTLASA